MKKLKIGVLGLGQRGYSLLDYVILDMKEFEVVAISDKYEDRVKEANELCIRKGVTPNLYTDSKELLKSEDLDCVFIATPWDSHIELSIIAMKRGIAISMEVGGAYEIHELWKLVDTYEETKTPFMLMENCCFGRLELMTKNMVDNDVLGEIVYMSGGYLHDLRDEVSEGYYRRHYRIDNYIKRDAENYPTHEIGPLSKLIGINKGNRFLTLSSQSSKSVGLNTYLKDNLDEKVKEAKGLRFKQGDVVTTTIKCANGELISLKLDTTLPRYYSRGFYVQGTKGLVNEDNNSVFLETDQGLESHFTWNKYYNNMEEYYERYEHPIWKKYLEKGVKKGHGGMDYLVFKSFADSLINNTQMYIDVYDAVVWMAITALSEQSIALGGQVLTFPDFTKGKWIYE